jgi:hypothetical protein
MLKKIIAVALIGVGSISIQGCQVISDLAKISDAALSTADIVRGLKDALTQGVTNGSQILSQRDGFFKNAAVKILFPDQAQNVANKLRGLGMGNIVDVAEEKINRAAEDAAVGAKDIFVNSIKQMSFDDGRKILMGQPNAATDFFRRTATTQLYNSFNPVIKASLNKVGAIDSWNKIITTYNAIPLVQKVNPNLDDHVTNKAIVGVFNVIEKEERDIRSNPGKRMTAIMKKVFAAQDKK